MSSTAHWRGTPPADPLNFVRVGSGPPLVLIHGLGHRWQGWEPVLDELSGSHDVIVPDLPGFGASPRNRRGATDVPALAAAVADLLAAEGIDRPHVAGCSLGGAIALELATAGLAASVTAFAPAGFATAAERRRALAILRTLRAATFLPAPVIRTVVRSRLLAALCFGPLVAHPSRLDRERMVRDALAMRRGRGFGPVARSLSRYEFLGRGSAEAPPRVSRDANFTGEPAIPVTIAWGDRDQILRPHQADRARARLPTAQHVVLRSCGHLPMTDDPARVASIILATTRAAKSS